MRRQRFWTAILILLLALAHLPVGRAETRVLPWTVINTADSGTGSLRWAISQANVAGGGDIAFAIPGTGVHTIQLNSPLPILSGGNTTIDGYSQTGAVPATDATPATIVVEIDGDLAGPGNGLSIISAGNTIKGLAINRFDWSGIAIGGASTMSNTIAGNHIGTDASGTVDYGNDRDGVSILLGAHDNTIGGDEDAERNVISGNGWDGVGMVGDNTTGNVVSHNYIGMGANGSDDLGNSRHGVHIYGGAYDNIVGGDAENLRNVIAGNDQDGVYIAGTGTRDNVIAANYIGLSADGTYNWQTRNWKTAVTITGDAQANIVGGDSEGERNIILFRDIAVLITGTNTMSNVVSGNFIGTITGTVPAINGYCCDGVVIAGGAHHNTIGGTTPDERNVIAGGWTSNCNSADVRISGANTRHNIVSGNHIGVDVSGTTRLSYSSTGVWIYDGGAQDNVVGGDTDGERNVISGKDLGVCITGADTTGNMVTGNYIGTNASGTGSIEGSRRGVYISRGAQDNVIGGDTPAEYNLISGNSWDGVYITGAGTTSNTVAGNYIGTGKGGVGALGNGRNGVYILEGAQGNTVGPGNVIAHNTWDGVAVNGSSTFDNAITRNSIFANSTGISLTNDANGAIAAPVIAATTLGSVHIIGTACPGCTVEVFQNGNADGEGETYVGEATADSNGTFAVTAGALTKPYLTATATDAISGTSEFSAAFAHTVHSVLLPLVMNGY